MFKFKEEVCFTGAQFCGDVKNYKEQDVISSLPKKVLEDFGLLIKNNGVFSWKKSTEFFEKAINNIEIYTEKEKIDFCYKSLLKNYKKSLKNLEIAERKISKLIELLPKFEGKDFEKLSQYEIKKEFHCIPYGNDYTRKNVYIISFDIKKIIFYREDCGFMKNKLVLKENSFSFKTGKTTIDLFKEFKNELEGCE